MKNIRKLLSSSILSGLFISISGIGYLVNMDIFGSVLFSFGLLSIINYKLDLFTGRCGFIKFNEIPSLILILFGNIIGCYLMSLAVRYTSPSICDNASIIFENRMKLGYFGGLIKSIGCGLIMTTAVTFGKKGNYLPLLFGIPLFILCGFPHCIADAFYYLCVNYDILSNNITDLIIFYISIVIGNSIGCNLYRLLGLDS